VRALGVSTAIRLPSAPDIPPIAETGVPGFDAAGWGMFAVPAGTPKEVVSKLQTALTAVLALPDVQQQIVKLGMIPGGTASSEELERFIAAEIARWGKVVTQGGIGGNGVALIRRNASAPPSCAGAWCARRRGGKKGASGMRCCNLHPSGKPGEPRLNPLSRSNADCLTPMQAFVGNLIQRKPRRALSPEFKHALAREVLKTERLRVIALIITAMVLAAALTTADVVAAGDLGSCLAGAFPHPLRMGRPWGVYPVRSVGARADLPATETRSRCSSGARYVGAFIETSLPSLLLVAHMTNMGAVPALGFVAPLFYFVFIILSTLRLDFWLSTFTGFVAATELLGLALFHPAARATAGDTMLAAAFLISRSAVIFACGVLAGAVGVQLRRQFEASIAAATTRDYVTNLFGQHVRPRWWTACSPPARQPAAMRGRSPSCSSTSVALRPQHAPARRRRLSTDWTRRLRYWSRSSIAMAAS